MVRSLSSFRFKPAIWSYVKQHLISFWLNQKIWMLRMMEMLFTSLWNRSIESVCAVFVAHSIIIKRMIYVYRMVTWLVTRIFSAAVTWLMKPSQLLARKKMHRRSSIDQRLYVLKVHSEIYWVNIVLDEIGKVLSSNQECCLQIWCSDSWTSVVLYRRSTLHTYQYEHTRLLLLACYLCSRMCPRWSRRATKICQLASTVWIGIWSMRSWNCIRRVPSFLPELMFR